MMRKTESAKSKKSGNEIEEKRIAVRKPEKKERKAEKEKRKAEKGKKNPTTEKREPGKVSGFKLLGIRNKIVVCFLVPIREREI